MRFEWDESKDQSNFRRGDVMKPTAIEGRPGMVSFRLEPGTPLTDEQRAELEALKNMPDSEIDTSDIP